MGGAMKERTEQWTGRPWVKVVVIEIDEATRTVADREQLWPLRLSLAGGAPWTEIITEQLDIMRTEGHYILPKRKSAGKIYWNAELTSNFANFPTDESGRI